MEILLEGRGLTRRFQKKGQTIEAVHEVSFTLQKGTALGIAGASGSGKSTLARMAAGLLLPSEGKLLFHGSPLEGKEGLRHLWKQLQMIFRCLANPLTRAGHWRRASGKGCQSRASKGRLRSKTSGRPRRHACFLGRSSRKNRTKSAAANVSGLPSQERSC